MCTSENTIASPHTAILIIIEGQETAFNGYYWKTVEKLETDPQLL
jgi:hypothetical protein